MAEYDLISLLAQHGHGARIVSDGAELKLACPLCNDHKERMFINRRTYLWACHNCGETGNLYALLDRALDLDPIDVYRISRNLDDRVPAVRVAVEEQLPEAVLPANIPLRNPSSPLEKDFWDYLMGPTRRLAPSEIVEYDMRACLSGRYALRVIVPVRQEGRVVSFVARAIVESYPWSPDFRLTKVLYPPGTRQAEILFNLDRVSGRDELVLVEGVFDAIRLKDRAVATLGAHLSVSQMQLLRAHGVRVVTMMWDPDDAGRRATQRAARLLVGNGFGVRIATLAGGQDPALASQVDLTHALAKAANESVLCSLTELGRRLRRREESSEDQHG